MASNAKYQLAQQVGFILRRANQRHLTIFANHIPAVTPTQFAAIAKLCELGDLSQSELGRQTAMDGATIKGVVDRLKKRNFVTTYRDNDDQRRLFVSATTEGRELFKNNIAAAKAISAQTLQNLSEKENETFLELLNKIT